MTQQKERQLEDFINVFASGMDLSFVIDSELSTINQYSYIYGKTKMSSDELIDFIFGETENIPNQDLHICFKGSVCCIYKMGKTPKGIHRETAVYMALYKDGKLLFSEDCPDYGISTLDALEQIYKAF
jgi:hypothetical protein